MAQEAEQYRWSSAAAHLGGEDSSGVLEMEFWRRSGGVDTWRQMHAAAEEPGPVELLRKCTYSGRPFGDEEFVERMETKFQRVWRRSGFEKMTVGA